MTSMMAALNLFVMRMVVMMMMMMMALLKHQDCWMTVYLELVSLAVTESDLIHSIASFLIVAQIDASNPWPIPRHILRPLAQGHLCWTP